MLRTRTSQTRIAITVTYLILVGSALKAQQWHEPSDSLNPKRAWLVTGAQSAMWLGSQGGLYFAWYSQFETEPFHLFNDWDEWELMDKVGHVATSYQTAWSLHKMNHWAGMSRKRSVIQALAYSYSFQTAFEVMDGFSSGWGFSMYDLGSNTLGSLWYLGQELAWKEQRILIKYSYWQDPLLRKNSIEGTRARALYGESITEHWLKDYNGQTYWVSANVWSLIGKPDNFPKWVNVAVGYSANNVLGGRENVWSLPRLSSTEADDLSYRSPLKRERQFLLSLDIDLQHTDLPMPLKLLKPVFGVIKFPFPALEWNTETGFGAHPLYW